MFLKAFSKIIILNKWKQPELIVEISWIESVGISIGFTGTVVKGAGKFWIP